MKKTILTAAVVLSIVAAHAQGTGGVGSQHLYEDGHGARGGITVTAAAGASNNIIFEGTGGTTAGGKKTAQLWNGVNKDSGYAGGKQLVKSVSAGMDSKQKDNRENADGTGSRDGRELTEGGCGTHGKCYAS